MLQLPSPGVGLCIAAVHAADQGVCAVADAGKTAPAASTNAAIKVVFMLAIVARQLVAMQLVLIDVPDRADEVGTLSA